MSIFSRAANLAAVPVKGGAKLAAAATSSMLGADKDTAYTKAATDTIDILATSLAKARGPAMKFGQALALFSSMLPPDQAQHLASLGRLYEDAEPRPFAAVADQLATLPDGVTVDEIPVNAASLGQVHRGTWTDGTPIAVKIQYPDAHRIVRADMLQLRTMIPILTRLLPTIDSKALLDEHTERLYDELNYLQEAWNQERFRRAWETTRPGIVTIPRVLHVSQDVLVSEWLPGILWSQVGGRAASERTSAGSNLARFLLWSAHLVGATHGDPHPGNYRLCPDGTVGVLDFGAIADPAGPFTSLFADTFRLWADDRLDDLRDEWARLGLVAAGTSTEELAAILAVDLDPYDAPVFEFSPAWAAGHTAGWSDPAEAWNRASLLSFPAELLLEHRAVAGLTALLVQANAIVDFRAVLDEVPPVALAR